MKTTATICMLLLLGPAACVERHDSTVPDGQPAAHPAADQDGQAAPADIGDTTPVKPRGQMKDGQRSGVWTFFHSNGQKSAEGEYSQGLKTGEWTFWDEGGNKIAAGTYKKGQKDGKWVDWDENGKKISERRYKDGREVFN